MRRLALILLALASAASWAQSRPELADTVFVTVTVTSQPDGAYITDMGKKVGGMSPQIYSYPASLFRKYDNGCIYTHGFDARWGSGAAASSSKKIRLCPSVSRDRFNLVVSRNPGDPDLDKDLRFAMELADRKQAAAAQAQAEKDRARTL